MPRRAPASRPRSTSRGASSDLARLRLAYAFASGAAIWTGWLGYVISGDVAQGRFEGTWFWLMTGGMLACNVWVAFELQETTRTLRRRVRLGLCEPIVADRVMLWGVGSVARAILVLAGPLSSRYLHAVAGSEAERLSTGAMVLVMSSPRARHGGHVLAGLPAAARILRWVEQRAARPARLILDGA